MSEVTYNGEEVVFEGLPPTDLKGLVKLFKATAASSGRVLLSVKVNGKEMLTSQLDMSFEKDTKVDVRSGTLKEMYVQAIDYTLKKIPAADATFDPLLESLLCESWESAFGKLNGFMQSLTPLFVVLGNLKQYSSANKVPWKGDLESHMNQLSGHFTKILELCEKKQVAELTSLLNFEFRPAFESLIAFVGAEVRDSFKAA